jgi:transposase
VRGNYSNAEKLERNARIVDMKLAGVPVREIAKLMGVSYNRILQIVKAFKRESLS